MSPQHSTTMPSDNILADRCKCRLGSRASARINQLEQDLAAERAARERAEAQLLERNQGGSRYARHT